MYNTRVHEDAEVSEMNIICGVKKRQSKNLNKYTEAACEIFSFSNTNADEHVR